MSVHRIACPECKYELMYATFGSQGSYKTGPGFAARCAHASEIEAENAMSCPVLRPVVERALRSQFPGHGMEP